MERSELAVLLTKHVNGNIGVADFQKLRTLLLKLDDETIDSCLYEVWQAYTPASKRNISTFEKVKENLKLIIRPEDRLTKTINPIHVPKSRSSFYIFRVAAMIAVPLLMSVAVYFFTKNSTINDLAANVYTIETANGERTRLTLPDGTRVMVSANSAFSYPAVFGKSNREVSLNGEAFFEVSPNKQLPFIVKSKEICVKVLGTKFNVYAYPNEDFFEVSLVEGKVQAYQIRNTKNAFVLTPNEKLRYNYASSAFEKSTTDLQVETAWTRGDLYFQAEGMHGILPKLERYYGVTFNIHGQLPTETLTASYHETDINEILRNLAIHYQFNYRKQGDSIIVDFQK